MESKEKVSIAILNYNGVNYLKQVIPSVLQLSYPNIEIIVVDNGSTDDSVSYLESLNKIKIIKNNENLGYSKGKNICVNNSAGEYILMLDNDILIQDNFLIQKLIDTYNKEIAFIQIPLIDVDKKSTFYYGTYISYYGLNMHRPSVSLEDIKNSGEIIKINGPTGGFIFFRKKIWSEIGGYDESQTFHIDDVDIGSRSYILGYKNYLLTSCYAIHLGINKTNSSNEYINRFKFVFSGHARSMIKNYKLVNIIWAFSLFSFYQFIKAIKYSFKKKSPSIFFAYLWSVKFFLKILPDTLKQRKIIQSKRKIKDDIFLKIKPINFNKNKNIETI